MRLLPNLFYYSSLCALFHLPRSINSQCKCDKGWNVGLGLGTQRVCYLFTNETGSVTWTKSKSYCNKKHNATLPMSKDVNMAHHLHNITYNQYLKHRWYLAIYAVGLRFNSKLYKFPYARSRNLAKAWVWEDGTPLSTLEGYPWMRDNPYDSYSSKKGLTRFYAMGFLRYFDKSWFIKKETTSLEMINVCQRNCNSVSTSPPSSTVSTIPSSTQSSTPSNNTFSPLLGSISSGMELHNKNKLPNANKTNLNTHDIKKLPGKGNTGYMVLGVMLILIALLLGFSFLLIYKTEKEKYMTELREPRKAQENVRMLRPNENIEMMSSTGRPELDAINTLDLFGGSSAASHNPVLVTLPDQDAETCPSISCSTHPEL